MENGPELLVQHAVSLNHFQLPRLPKGSCRRFGADGSTHRFGMVLGDLGRALKSCFFLTRRNRMESQRSVIAFNVGNTSRHLLRAPQARPAPVAVAE